ncbi:hypothetical protein ACFWOT_20380 [Streptomyces sp. NPDC058440]|uniref:hypothetical protein n=1 Tax=Streptomyces sp. NPDC058440 TaxID=3346501 RepID=UPI00365CC463
MISQSPIRAAASAACGPKAETSMRDFLGGEDRESDFRELTAEPDAVYDLTDEIDLSALEPLIARPTSPSDVVPVRKVAGEPIGQAVIGSSANPGLRDFAIAAAIISGRQTHPPSASTSTPPHARCSPTSPRWAPPST